MLYYGGSTFGWNQAPQVSIDPELHVLAYYTDFYGYLSYNLPAAWKYKNLLLTSVHPEADNCTKFDCPAAGTIPEENVLQNRAWLLTHVNAVAGTRFVVPKVPLEPSFDASAPHSSYPSKSCYQGGVPRTPPILFCDDFDAAHGTVPSGLWNWERGQTSFNNPPAWNTSYTSVHGGPAEGNGYALAVQSASEEQWASITTFPVQTPPGTFLTFKRRGVMSAGGLFTVQYTTNSGQAWVNLQLEPLSSSWNLERYALPVASSLRVRFNCGGKGFCALDSVYISALASASLVV